MAPKSNKNKSSTHSFRGCREVLLNNIVGGSGVSSSAYNVNIASGGSTYGIVLAPVGLSGVTLASGSFNNPGAGVSNLSGPPLRGLYNRAIDFQWYRITRAKLVFVGNVGNNVPGQVLLAGYTDPSDIKYSTTAAYVSSPHTKVFDLSSSGSKELSVPVPVDTAWKKVTSITSLVGNSFPYASGAATNFAVVNTVSDLAFGAVYCATYNSSAPDGTTLGNLFLDYDVEFKSPIDPGVNA